MKAIEFDTFGDADVLKLTDVAEPELRSTDLLIKVHAAGVNRADIIHRRGGYGRPHFGDSAIMGLEIAGEVVATGVDANGFKIGDRIMGIVGGGAYAELARIDYRMAMRIPDTLTFVQAAAIPEAFVTAHEALVHLGRLKAGETVLIHAAASGVGSAAVQLARLIGARIFGTADVQKLGRVKELGVSYAVDYKVDDYAEVIAQITDRKGVDVVIDFIGAPYFPRNIASLANGGRLVQVGLLGGGGSVNVEIEQILYRHLQIMGTVMKSRPQPEKHNMVQRFSSAWLNHFGDNRLVPVLDSVFPLSRAKEAHLRMESGQNFGKIILSME
jgi:putative PIG3 family NAD(P)H quinone oxidoreductase